MKMTRRDIYISKLMELLHPLSHSLKDFGNFGEISSVHGRDISWFEMFARSTYGIVALSSVNPDNEYVDVFNHQLIRIVTESRYKDFIDYDQKAVELIPLILMLYKHKNLTWNKYSDEERQGIISYFENINKIAIHTNNWQFFRIIVDALLEKLTGKDFSAQISNAWKAVDECYVGEGWFTDGKRGPKDYYIAFGYHFYSLLYSYLINDEERNQQIFERAVSFAKQYFLMFDHNGRSIPFGRSLIYRYAVLSFWSMILLNGLMADEKGRILHVIEKSLAWWSNQKTCDENGVLNLGYAYENSLICENYNSSGSPYWVMKFFLILLLDPKDELWRMEMSAAEAAVEETVIVDSVANGDITVVKNNMGCMAYINSYSGSPHNQNSAKYMRFAYSSLTGFNINKDNTNFRNLSDDNALVFNIAGVKHMREKNTFYRMEKGVQHFYWECGDLIQIHSMVIPMTYGYVRAHVITSAISCEAYETGFPISKGNNRKYKKEVDYKYAYVDNGNITSSIFSVTESGGYMAIENEINSNIFYPETVMPSVVYPILKGKNLIVDVTLLSESHCLKEIMQPLRENICIKNKTLSINGGQTIHLGDECEDIWIVFKKRQFNRIKKIIKGILK